MMGGNMRLVNAVAAGLQANRLDLPIENVPYTMMYATYLLFSNYVQDGIHPDPENNREPSMCETSWEEAGDE